jgi:metallo-beta-lactamase family protein
MKLSFHGAAREVTGSCHLLEVGSIKILIDCGMYQGGKGLTEENLKPFGFKAKDINYLLLTHAHLDHCGRIPLLVKQGFRGEIITTSASRELAKLVMLDSAHVHEEEAKRNAKHFKRSYKHSKKSKHHSRPLYTTLDVLNSLDYFGRNAAYEKPIKLSNRIQATFFDAGHILGAASIFLEIGDGNSKKSIIFSGDIGNKNKPIIRDPASLPQSDIVVMETTYGDRSHKSIEGSVSELYLAINDTFKRGGNVYIPTFALERAQELLFFLREGVEKGKLPRSMQVFLDSPMAISATEIYKRHSECYDEESAKIFEQNKDPFSLPNLSFTRDVSESIEINNIKSGAVIMAGSGMCNGGRICQHLKHNLWREDCSVIFVSFAAGGTIARKIIDGAKTIYLYGEEISVRAKVYTINGFSSHAGTNELLQWHKNIGKPETTFLVHGAPEAMASFAGKLKAKGNNVRIPALHESYTI